MLTILIASIQIYQPGKQNLEGFQVEDSNEKFVDELEHPESDSEEERIRNPEQETFTMTENPMFYRNPELRQRFHQEVN